MLNEELQVLIDFLSANRCKNIALYGQTIDSQEGYVLLANVASTIENKKLADKFIETFAPQLKPEGYSRGEWIIFDLGQVVVQTFIPPKREKYNLDKLYQNKKINILKEGK